MPHLLHHLLEDTARQNPGGVAVVDGDVSVTYAELDERANQLAHLLCSLGVARGDRVGIYLRKSIDAVVGIYGVLKSGGVYVPLDPDAPVERVGAIAGDCAIRCMVTADSMAPRCVGILGVGAPVETFVTLGAFTGGAWSLPDGVARFDGTAVDGQPSTAPVVASISLDLAYILYTSGSTGIPKGVMLSHANALAFVDWGVERFAVEASDRLSSHAPLHFDLSIFDVFVAAKAAARVVLVPPGASLFPVEIGRFIERNAITIWYSVPSILSMVVLRGGLSVGSCPSLRLLLFAGEVFPTKYLRALMNLLPHAEFHNLYGPTETNVCTHFQVSELAADDDATIPIGAAITDVEVFALTGEGALASPGDVGELYVRGATVTTGYWDRPELTAATLSTGQVEHGRHDRAYRTGDLVRQDDQGQWHFIGRRDAQIKSRGYRIELGDIEAALNASPLVAECAVIAVPDEVVTNRIVAFVALSNPAEAADPAAICRTRLPGYMVPERFVLRKELPKTSTGKIDRQVLTKSLGGEAHDGH